MLQDREFSNRWAHEGTEDDFRLYFSNNVNVGRRSKRGGCVQISIPHQHADAPVPALRERPTDIPVGGYFLRKYAAPHGKEVMSFHADVVEGFGQFLVAGQRARAAAVIERAVILTQGHSRR